MSEKAVLEVNGQVTEYARDALPKTVAQLIDALGLDAAMVVAEVNGDIVKRRDIGSRPLADGDKIELVRFVGGG